MRHLIQRGATIAMWFLALLMAAFSLRYFFFSAATNDALEAQAAAVAGRILATRDPIPVLETASHNRPFVLMHVAGGIIATICGLFQFLPRLRAQQPALHRLIGKFYIGGVAVGVAGGLPLSFLVTRHLPAAVQQSLLPSNLSFATLAMVGGGG
jgi:RsiW-degrading membrane proteinase PrsW (M82 family)